jgi:acyl carrier protein phosphodiesterase
LKTLLISRSQNFFARWQKPSCTANPAARFLFTRRNRRHQLLCLVSCTLCLVNYLAHAYLSFGDPEILVGNLISDFVKGKKKFDYPEGIQKGIILHRQIDAFTDEHNATKLAKNVFRPSYRLYSGAFVDVVYDHFLAVDEHEFPGESLLSFSENVYKIVDPFINELPERFCRMFPYMKMQNWLYHYRTRWGTEKSFGGLVRRSAYLEESDTASSLFNQNYQQLYHCYKSFFPEVKIFARHIFDELKKQ